jgi:hypothetical protein
VEKYGRVRKITDDNILLRMRVANLITKYKNTNSEYLIFIAFPRQQWLLKARLSVAFHLHRLSRYFIFSFFCCFVLFISFFLLLFIRPSVTFFFSFFYFFSIFSFLLHLPITLSLISEQTPLQKLEQYKSLEVVRVDSSLIRFLDEGATMTVRVYWN